MGLKWRIYNAIFGCGCPDCEKRIVNKIRRFLKREDDWPELPYTPALAGEIESWAEEYLRGEITLHEFRSWFAPATWDVHILAPTCRDLSYSIDAALMRFNDGEFNEAMFGDALWHLLKVHQDKRGGTNI